MNRLGWSLHLALKGLRHPHEVRWALRRRMNAVLHAKRLREMMEIDWYAARRGIAGREWRRVVYDYARRGFPVTPTHTLSSLAGALASIFEDDSGFTRRSLACVEHAASLTYQWESEVLANGVMTMLSTGRLREPPVTVSYQLPPFVAKVDRSPENMALLAAQRRRAGA